MSCCKVSVNVTSYISIAFGFITLIRYVIVSSIVYGPGASISLLINISAVYICISSTVAVTVGTLESTTAAFDSDPTNTSFAVTL